ncbi:hypothetical protein C0966_17125 (plasmid) [Bacillus methanolicus]|nr:hypothetical protein [Bacillus methanolicus]
MYKKITAIALTGALTLGSLGPILNQSFFNPFSETKVEAAMIQGETLETQKVYGREEGAYIAGTVAVYGKKPGTVVFKLSPNQNSEWSVGEKLTLYSRMVLADTAKKPVQKSEIIDDNGQKYVLAYIYVSDPTKFVGVGLHTHSGEYGYDPIKYEAFYIEGKDLTKEGSTSPTIPNTPRKVYWEGAELKPGQIGKIDVVKPINLWKRDDNKLTFVRILYPGESYRVYSYDSKFGGQYGLGGGYYITNMKGFIKYKTPSKAKLAELNK